VEPAYLEDGGNRFLRKLGYRIPDYMPSTVKTVATSFYRNNSTTFPEKHLVKTEARNDISYILRKDAASSSETLAFTRFQGDKS